jgi:hypothetical protein
MNLTECSSSALRFGTISFEGTLDERIAHRQIFGTRIVLIIALPLSA